jgi:hypothetical protein
MKIKLMTLLHLAWHLLMITNLRDIELYDTNLI